MPVTPPAARTGSPSAAASGRAKVARSTITPKNTSSAPTPTTRSAARTSSAESAAHDADHEDRRADDHEQPAEHDATPEGSDARAAGTSLMAATGGIVDARTAGQIEAPTVTNKPTASAATTVRDWSTRSPSGTSKPIAPTSENRTRANSTPSTSPTSRRDSADDRRLDDHRADDLAPARAHGTEQPELVRALRDEDRERVEDDERGDDQADGGEAEEHSGEEVEELADVGAAVGSDLGREHDLERRPDRVDELPAELGTRYAVDAADVDRIDEAVRGHEPLRGAERERGERHRTDRAAVSEREHADEIEPLLRARRQHVDPIADPEPVLARGLDVHRDLVRGARRAAAAAVDVEEPERPALAASDPRHAERRRGVATDCLPVLPDELRVPLDEATRGRDGVDGPHLAKHRVAEALVVVVTREWSRAEHDVDAGQRLVEHTAERPVQGVGEHVRRAHEAHAEDHREAREREPELPREHTADRRPQHRRPVRAATAP